MRSAHRVSVLSERAHKSLALATRMPSMPQINRLRRRGRISPRVDSGRRHGSSAVEERVTAPGVSIACRRSLVIGCREPMAFQKRL
jgi:hypothetical protein